MRPFTTLRQGSRVVVIRNTHSDLSYITDKDIGKKFIVRAVEYGGRRHNTYIAQIFLKEILSGVETRACIDELAIENPNFEPMGEFIVCVGCGATIESDCLVDIPVLDAQSCPRCNMLNPTES